MGKDKLVIIFIAVVLTAGFLIQGFVSHEEGIKNDEKVLGVIAAQLKMKKSTEQIRHYLIANKNELKIESVSTINKTPVALSRSNRRKEQYQIYRTFVVRSAVSSWMDQFTKRKTKTSFTIDEEKGMLEQDMFVTD